MTIMHKETEEKTIPTLADQDDPTASERKRDHIELAFQSQIAKGDLDHRFYYEPLLAGHPTVNSLKPLSFLGKKNACAHLGFQYDRGDYFSSYHQS